MGKWITYNLLTINHVRIHVTEFLSNKWEQSEGAEIGTFGLRELIWVKVALGKEVVS